MPASSHDVAIIGGGASGVLTAAQLHRQQPDLTVALIDSTGSGRGLAYGTPHDCHLLNVPAGNMSAFPDQPEHFFYWLRQRDPWAAKTTFAPRKLYGEYLASVLEEACGESKVSKVVGTAVAVEKRGASWVVKLDDGQTIEAKAVVLALGNLPPSDLPSTSGLSKRRYAGNPWAAGALDPIQNGVGAPPDAAVFLIGTGLTAIDVVLALRANGHVGPIHCISRRGLLPQVHAPCEPWKLSEEQLSAHSSSPRALLKWLRTEIRRAEETESDRWRAVIDAMRPHNQRIWQGWSEAEKRRFLRHARAHWEVHRHRAAPEIIGQVEKLKAMGLLQMHKGRIAAITESGSAVRVRWIGKHRMEWELEVDRVINCTGPDCDFSRLTQPLIVQMREAGLLVPDRMRLSIETDDAGRVLDKSGAAIPGLWAVGPLRKARLWESTAMPEIRVQAERMGSIDL